MRGSVFMETLRQSWQQVMYWAVGLTALGFIVVVIIPDVNFLKQMADLVRSLPPFLQQAVGVGDDINFIATPEGFVAVGFFGKGLLLMAAYPVLMGLRVTVTEEDSGTMDMLLSLPLPRWRIIVEKYLAYCVTMVAIVITLFIGFWIGEALTPVELNMTRVAETVFNMIPCMMLILAVTVFVGTLSPGKRFALAVATLFVVVSFMLDTVGGMATGTVAENLKALSVFSYYNSTGVMKNGLIWANIAGMVILSFGLLWGSIYLFERRDIGM